MLPTSGSGLKSLIEEARRRHDDTRPDMLRLLVELYLGVPGHDGAEQDRFAKLATRLVDSIDAPVAARLMRPLAARHDLPRALALHLARGPLALAGPVLRLSPVLDDATLAVLAEELPASHAAAITARREVSPALAKKLADLVHRTSEAPALESQSGEENDAAHEALADAPLPAAAGDALPAAEALPPEVLPPDARLEEALLAETLPPEPAPPETAPVETPHVETVLIETAPPPAAVAVAPDLLTPASPTPDPALPAAETAQPAPAMLARADYLAASPEDRALIIARLVTLPPLAMAERVAPAGAEMSEAMLEAARNGTPAQVAVLVERALGVSPDNAARIVDDPSGQALAVAARALGLSFAVLSRMLFRLHPVVGRSAAEMTRLADMFDSLTSAGAQNLVAAWRIGRRTLRDKAEDAPSMRSFAQPRPAPSTAADPAESRRPG